MRRPGFLAALLYGCTIFLSAFLLFLIQPVFAKLILPWFGGSAAVWTTCLVFFQLALLGGYLYAYALVRWMKPSRQAAFHVALLACALFTLPAIPASHWQPAPGSNPLWRLLSLLTVVLGLPFFLLSTTGPLLQAWFAHKWPEADTYRLFAVSNAAALLALLAYPILIEPHVATRMQDVVWSFGFAGFAILCAATAWISRRGEMVTRRAARPPGGSLLTWFALAAGGSMLLLSTTNQITQNIAAVPFLWIGPLIVYLVTFILCFESSRWYRRGLYLRLLAMGLAAVAYTIYDIQLTAAIFVSLPVLLFGLFAGCMFCHGELSALKPSKENLTAFYLMIAAGGAAGAVFVGLIAPAVFSGVYELPVSLLFVAVVAGWLNWTTGWSQRLLWSAVALTMAIVVGAQFRAYHLNALVVTRDFYGALRVVESGSTRTLYHGTIQHGSQLLSRRRLPTTYYGPPSGAGLALRNCCDGPKRVGVVGLGAGTLAAYGRAGDEFRFYEIDPEVIELAGSQFTFLKDSPAAVEIAPGDARLTLERESPQHFDVLALDAFSGDAIPVHLLTKEAFAVYFRHLTPSGVLAVHVSNQYLDLAPVVERLAWFYGKRAVLVQSEKDPAQDLLSATWVLVTSSADFLGRPAIANAARPIRPRAGLRLWTDDYNNLFQVIR